jgi:predicted nucleic acid-binding protein
MIGSIVVSDASPLHYLILIQAVDFLPTLATEVLIPPAVASELTDAATPALVHQWVSQPPFWLKILAPQNQFESFGLDAGEAESIALATELGIAPILIDERKGFRVAKTCGLKPIGLLAVLETLASNGQIDFDEYIIRLRATNFRLHDRLIREARQRLQTR